MRDWFNISPLPGGRHGFGTASRHEAVRQNSRIKPTHWRQRPAQAMILALLHSRILIHASDSLPPRTGNRSMVQTWELCAGAMLHFPRILGKIYRVLKNRLTPRFSCVNSCMTDHGVSVV
jgi:hypothetical protein